MGVYRTEWAEKAFVLTKHSWDMHRTDPNRMPRSNITVLRMLRTLVQLVAQAVAIETIGIFSSKKR